MEFLFSLVTIGLITFLGAMSPGPDIAIIVKNSLTRSRKAGIATSIGVVLGNLVYISLVLLGLGALITASASVFTVLKYLGALYLIYLGIKIIRAKSKDISISVGEHAANPNLFYSLREGFITNLSNPKFMIFLLAVFTQVISPGTPFMARLAYGLEIPVVALIWFTILSFIITMPFVRNRISGILRYVERATGAVLIALGTKIALEASR
jgi:RhtB (resistance to homoserine/threonine) family protein